MMARLMSVNNTAKYLGISSKTIRNQLCPSSKEKFPVKPKRIGRRVLFDRVDLEKYIKSISVPENKIQARIVSIMDIKSFLDLVHTAMALRRDELSQWELAQRVGVCESLLSKYLRGRRTIPDEVKKKLINELKIEYKSENTTDSVKFDYSI